MSFTLSDILALKGTASENLSIIRHNLNSLTNSELKNLNIQLIQHQNATKNESKEQKGLLSEQVQFILAVQNACSQMLAEKTNIKKNDFEQYIAELPSGFSNYLKHNSSLNFNPDLNAVATISFAIDKFISIRMAEYIRYVSKDIGYCSDGKKIDLAKQIRESLALLTNFLESAPFTYREHIKNTLSRFKFLELSLAPYKIFFSATDKIEYFAPLLLNVALEYGPEIPAEQLHSIIGALFRAEDLTHTQLQLEVLINYFGPEIILNNLLTDVEKNSDLYSKVIWERIIKTMIPSQFITSLGYLIISFDQKRRIDNIFKAHFSAPDTAISDFNLEEWYKTRIRPQQYPDVLDRSDLIDTDSDLIDTDFEIDDHTFAHINNDHVLKGTVLEGSVIGKTLKVYSNFFDNYLTEQLPPKYLKKLKPASDIILNCLAINELLEKALTKFKALKFLGSSKAMLHAAVIDELTDAIYKKLQKNNGGLFPGGWIGLNDTAGHAMVYELRATSPKGYAFIIHNSGAGINFHQQKVNAKGKVVYSTLKAYEIDGISIKGIQKQLKALIRTTLIPQLEPASIFNVGYIPYDEKKLYEEIEQTTTALKMLEADPKRYFSGWTTGQKSGSCTWRAYRSYFKSFCQQQEISYDHLSLKVKLFALNAYYEVKTRKNRLGVLLVQNQMRFAIADIARHILSLKDARLPQWSATQRMDAFKLLRKISRALDANKRPLQSTNITPQTIILEREKSSSPFNIQYQPTAFCAMSSSKSLMPAPAELKSTTGADSLTAPAIILQNLLSVCEINIKNGHYNFAARAIEDYYNGLPLSSSYWSTLDKRMLAMCMSNLRFLNDLYATSIANNNVIPFAHQATTLYSALCIGQNIAEAYFNTDEDRQIKEILFEGNSIRTIAIDNLKATPYFINPDFHTNHRFSALQHYFKQEVKEATDVNPLEHILCRNKSITDKILAKERENNKPETVYPWDNLPDSFRAAVYYCHNRDSLKDLVPSLEDDICIATSLNKLTYDIDLLRHGRLDSVDHDINNLTPLAFYDFLSKSLMTFKASPNLTTGELALVGQINFERTSKFTYSLKDAQPSLTKQMANIIENDPLSCNHIQTSSVKEKDFLTPELAFHRSLLHTRVDKNTQMAATVDLMTKHFTKCIDPDVQQFIFLNLFHSDLLHQQLIENSSPILILIDLIEQGLLQFGLDADFKGRLKQPAVYFLKLSQTLATALSSHQPPLPISLQECIQALARINECIPKLIAHYEILFQNHPNEQLNDILKQLHGFNIIRIRNQMRINPLTTVDSALRSHLRRKSLAVSGTEDAFQEHEVTGAFTQLEPIFKKEYLKDVKVVRASENLAASLFDMLPCYKLTLPLDNSHYHWEGTYPNYALILTIPKLIERPMPFSVNLL